MSQQKPTEVEAVIYAREFITHGNKTRAFQKTFPNSKAKHNILKSKACVFHKSNAISEAISKLSGSFTDGVKKEMQRTNDEFHVSIDERRRLLLDAVKLGLHKKYDKHGNEIAHSIPGAVSAIAELNRMYGDHAPTKIQTSTVSDDLSAIPTENLEKALSLLTQSEDGNNE